MLKEEWFAVWSEYDALVVRDYQRQEVTPKRVQLFARLRAMGFIDELGRETKEFFAVFY